MDASLTRHFERTSLTDEYSNRRLALSADKESSELAFHVWNA